MAETCITQYITPKQCTEWTWKEHIPRKCRFATVSSVTFEMHVPFHCDKMLRLRALIFCPSAPESTLAWADQLITFEYVTLYWNIVNHLCQLATRVVLTCLSALIESLRCIIPLLFFFFFFWSVRRTSCTPLYEKCVEFIWEWVRRIISYEWSVSVEII